MSARCAIDNALCEHMPLMECMRAMYVRLGTKAAEGVLKEAEEKIARARDEHERAKSEVRRVPPLSASQTSPPLGTGERAIRAEKKSGRRSDRA